MEAPLIHGWGGWGVVLLLLVGAVSLGHLLWRQEGRALRDVRGFEDEDLFGDGPDGWL